MDPLALALGAWITCGIAGAIVGYSKENAAAGLLCGLLLGPLGVLVAFSLDGRRQCPNCAARLNRGARQCGQCAAAVEAAPDRSQPLHRATTSDIDDEASHAERLKNRTNLPPRTR